MGTAISWKATMFMQQIRFIDCACIVGFAVFFHQGTWNHVHSKMHGVEDVGLPRSIPRFFIPIPHWWQEFIVAYHGAHHNSKGRYNFNIVFPGADHLFGTYTAPEYDKAYIWHSDADTKNAR